jgi:hypothetical protein
VTQPRLAFLGNQRTCVPVGAAMRTSSKADLRIVDATLPGPHRG